ncbi:hypothetical protein [Helicobacter sp. 13S00477-4]|uniref:hypothetical protein n=1 Tax=Helicobacter sp. 13S00477-4 TaxID=1905759 RepID=UPI000BD94680|nr:hypothetical protein [Helicobacter sp. 13S00477-4]PAF50614.1 hypothetical protein BKH44_07500 [Helicobacter sp. 13S00477-4]
MSKIFFLVFFAVLGFCKEPIWNFDKNIILKKDEVYKGFAYEENLKKPLILRWTLYKNNGLVVLLNYDKFPYQFILYKDYQRDTFKLPLFVNNGSDKTSFLYISFKDFDQKANTASLWIGISGEANFLSK